jgi:hypothetical protein
MVEVVFRGSKGALSCLVEKSTGVNVAEESVVVVAVWELDGLVEASRASKSMSKLAPLTGRGIQRSLVGVVERTSFHSLARGWKALSSLDTLRRGLVYTRPEALRDALRGG